MNKINIEAVLNQVEKRYPGLRETAHLILSSVTTLFLKRQHPLVIILVGAPSSGKTSLLSALIRSREGGWLKNNTLRLDEFTPASLVSHAANMSEERLKNIDLLPRMKNKNVIVKEMAPLFSGNEEILQKKFSTLTSILDGEGYITSSGTHGLRGYDEPTVFTLLGAVATPALTAKTMKTLSAIGPRMCFWQMPERHIDHATWSGLVNPKIEDDELLLREMISDYFDHLAELFEIGSVEISHFIVSPPIQKLLDSCAILMAQGRSIISSEKEGTETLDEIYTESPERAFRYVQQISYGAALADMGRMTLNENDVRLAAMVAISSAGTRLRKIIRIFFDFNEPLTAAHIHGYSGQSDDSDRRRLDELVRLRVIEQVSESGSKQWDLVPHLRALRSSINKVPPNKCLEHTHPMDFADNHLF